MSTPPSELPPYYDPRVFEDRQKLRAWAFQQALRIASSTENDVTDVLEDAERIFNYVANEPDFDVPHPTERARRGISTTMPGSSSPVYSSSGATYVTAANPYTTGMKNPSF